MSLFERWRGKDKNSKVIEKVITYFHSLYGSSNNITKFTESSAYNLAFQLSEVFFPIDAIADRAASIPYEIRDKNDNPITLSLRQKELLKKPNIFNSFSDLVYSIVFSLLADGNQYTYTNYASNNPSADMISSIWSIPPPLMTIEYKKNIPSVFNAKSKSDLVEYYKVIDNKEKIDPRFITHTTTATLRKLTSIGIEGRSPLCPAEKNINNLLAVYEARFKIYDSNGMAGILSRAATTSAGGDIAAAMLDANPITQEKMYEDLTGEYGLRGDKKAYGFAPYPIQFTKTLASIRELMPFEETLADAIAIAGVYGVDKDLVPQLKGTTFTNKDIAEVGLWQNVVKGVAYDVASVLNDAFCLSQDQHFAPVFDDVEALQEDKKQMLESDKLIIENLRSIKDGDLRDDPIVKRILEGYGKA